MVLTTEFYNLLHTLEKDYGSVSNVPNENPCIIALRKMSELSSEERERKALKLIEAGYSMFQVSQETGLSNSACTALRQKHHIPLVPVFKYKINNIYFPSSHKAADYFRLGTYHWVMNKLRDKGFTIHSYEYNWEDIPINGMYVNKFGKLHVKVSENIRTYNH